MVKLKNYIYGKYKIIEHIYNKYENKNEMVINCRFDIFVNSTHTRHNEILDLIKNNINTINIFNR
jgi:hypothetical protein